MDKAISFRLLASEDLPLLHGWLNQPHMRHFYQSSPVSLDEVRKKYTPRIEGREPVHSHVAWADDTPFGKIQCYLNEDYPDYANQIGVKDGVSLDLFIGNPAFLKRGLGKAMLAAYLNTIVPSLFPEENRFYICHEKGNTDALQCSKACGFEFLKDVIEDGKSCELLVRK